VLARTNSLRQKWPGRRKKGLDERLPDMPHWSLHDLRRTMATGMGELGVQPHCAAIPAHHQQ
jgi:hypothetical protein